jgi:hypothetical protein
MATTFSGTNISDMNRKQLRAIARNVQVASITEHSNLTTAAQLITAIKAK